MEIFKSYLRRKVLCLIAKRAVRLQVCKTEPGGLPFMKKENIHYLCATVTVKRPVEGFIYRYKCDNGQLERRRIWDLHELQKVDGVTSNTKEFILQFDREFKFQCENEQDKSNFLRELAGMTKYVSKPASFVNVDSTVTGALNKSAQLMTAQLNKNKEMLSERQEKLGDVEKATADMAHSAEKFSESAHKLSAKYE